MSEQQPISSQIDWAGLFDRRPLLIVVAGPNGAGKTTFFETYLASSKLEFLNADALSKSLNVDAYRAAEMASNLRKDWIAERRSFIFETVLSDPVQEKVKQLKAAADSGYAVAFIFIGIDSAETSDNRVGLRVTRGGHDVPREKLLSRFDRTMTNLRAAIEMLPFVFVYDNNDLAAPYQLIATYENGFPKALREPLPKWFPE